MPSDGMIEHFDLADAVGAIVLSSGGELRFGRSACDFEPVVGLQVRVLEADVSPLNRLRATRIERRASPDEHEKLLDARDREAGLPARGFSSSAEGPRFAKLSVATTSPMPDRAAVRAFWERTGASAIAKLDFVPSPIVTIRHHEIQALFGDGPFDSVLDTRHRPDGAPLGTGFVGFWMGTPKLARNDAFRMASAWGFGPRSSARPLLQLVSHFARQTEEVPGVIVGCADAMWLPSEEWLRRAGDFHDPDRIPVEAFVDVAYGAPDEAGVRRLRSFGMMLGLALPDVEVDDALAAHDDAHHRLAESVAWAACRVLAGEDAHRAKPPRESLPIGGIVKVHVEEGLVTFRVLGFTDEEEHTLRLGELRVVGA